MQEVKAPTFTPLENVVGAFENLTCPDEDWKQVYRKIANRISTGGYNLKQLLCLLDSRFSRVPEALFCCVVVDCSLVEDRQEYTVSCGSNLSLANIGCSFLSWYVSSKMYKERPGEQSFEQLVEDLHKEENLSSAFELLLLVYNKKEEQMSEEEWYTKIGEIPCVWDDRNLHRKQSICFLALIGALSLRHQSLAEFVCETTLHFKNKTQLV